MENHINLRKDTEVRLLERLNELDHRITSEEFRKTTRTTNTVNYWVFDYNPKQELMVRNHIACLQRKLEDASDDIRLYVIDLYELLIQHLENNRYIEQCKRFERNHDLEYLTTAVKNSLQLTNDRSENAMVKYITELVPIADNSIVFLTGVGKCYPLLQGPEVFNQILYNMPDGYRRTPMLLFYPGTYTEQELIIFNEMQEDNYYRAFRIVR